MKVNQLFESRDAADEFISDWTYSPDWHRKNPTHASTANGFAAAVKAYPSKAKKLYRGLSFDTITERAKVQKQLETGVYSDKALSSWTTDKLQALIFALLDDDFDNNTGIPGFVISMVPPAGTKMVNAAKSPRGENEIIVAGGTYNIKIESRYDN